MTTGERLLEEQIKTNELLEKSINIQAELSNQNLDIIAGLEILRVNTFDIKKNTYFKKLEND